MKQAIEDWVNWMHGRRLSLTTVSGYVWELERLAVKHPGLGAFDFRARHLNQYLAERRLLGVIRRHDEHRALHGSAA